jgi:Fe-S-cluster containining protein
VDLNLANMLGQVKLAMMDASEKAAKRRLTVYGDKVRCKSACDGCCARLVHLTVAEATVIQEHLSKTGQWAEVRARAVALAPTVRSANAVSWFKMNLKCPVLDEEKRTCRAYAVRPTPCSVHFAASDPSLCDPWSPKGGDYRPVEMEDVHEDFVRRTEPSLDGHGILALRLAMPLALLLAERIKYQRGMSVQEVMSLVYNEFR